MSSPLRQRGIGLPAAIFVITLMIAIAVGINVLVSQNAETFEEEVGLTRAFYAAESGAGMAMHLLFPPALFPDYNTRQACTDMQAQFDFDVDGLRQCRTELSCVLDATVDEVDYFTVTSQGVCGAIRRTVQVRTSYTAPIPPEPDDDDD